MALNDKQLELRLCPVGVELIQEEHPVAASRSGKNTVFHYCDVFQRRASYAGCLATMEVVADGRGDMLTLDCENAIQCGNCPAVEMRKMELRAKRALFFVDYVELSARRQAKIAEDQLNSPVQFGRSKRKSDRKFEPTRIDPSKVEVDVPVAVPVVTAPVSTPTEIQTNIMERVLKKKVENVSD